MWRVWIHELSNLNRNQCLIEPDWTVRITDFFHWKYLKGFARLNAICIQQDYLLAQMNNILCCGRFQYKYNRRRKGGACQMHSDEKFSFTRIAPFPLGFGMNGISAFRGTNVEDNERVPSAPQLLLTNDFYPCACPLFIFVPYKLLVNTWIWMT